MTTPVSQTNTTTQSFLDSLKQQQADKSVAANAQDRFLKLLVTQMQNQDPLNPMDNAEVTSQIAQISTVNGIEKINTTLSTMSQAFLASQTVQATGMIGHEVLAPGNAMTLQSGKGFAGVQLDSAADQVTVSIVDKTGATVRTLQLGGQKSGTVNVAWDGKTDDGSTAKDGNYFFKVKAALEGDDVKATALGYGLVQSVTLGNGSLQLSTDKLGLVSMSDIKQII